MIDIIKTIILINNGLHLRYRWHRVQREQLKEYLAKNLESFSEELSGEESKVRGINKAANEIRRRFLRMESYDPDVITNFEPRAILQAVTAIPDYDRNAYEIKVEFYVVNRPTELVDMSVLLERLR